MWRKLTASVLALLTVTALAGCEEMEDDYGTSSNPDTSAESRVFRTSDGRKVTCLYINGGGSVGNGHGSISPSGLSCDWEHAE